MLMKSIEHMFQAASACCSHKSEALSQTVFRWNRWEPAKTKDLGNELDLFSTTFKLDYFCCAIVNLRWTHQVCFTMIYSSSNCLTGSAIKCLYCWIRFIYLMFPLLESLSHLLTP